MPDGQQDHLRVNGTDDSKQVDKQPWMKFVSAGGELAGISLAVAAIGYALDQYLGSKQSLGTAFGLLIGFGFGMYRFIRLAMQSTNEAASEPKNKKLD
ncbi:MAG: AtpZ/AtpI family protein [Rubripirellula sp.]